MSQENKIMTLVYQKTPITLEPSGYVIYHEKYNNIILLLNITYIMMQFFIKQHHIIQNINKIIIIISI